jgi:hypothetical protein
VRWSGSPLQPSRLGEIGWAFEYNDRMGRFNCFYYGASEPASDKIRGRYRVFWHERCITLPELTKAMTSQETHNAGYDEAKVFEVEDADPEIALQFIAQRSALSEEMAARRDLIEETREILARYGVRGMPVSKGFSAPFLWYNMLPGKSVPVRKLAVHLFQMRLSSEEKDKLSTAELEHRVRELVAGEKSVLGLGECFAGRIASRFVIGLTIAVDRRWTVGQARDVAERLESEIRKISAQVGYVFIQTEAFQGGQ